MIQSGKAEDIPGATKLAIMNGRIEETKEVIDTIGRAENLHIKTIVIKNRESIKVIMSQIKVILSRIKVILSQIKVIMSQIKVILSQIKVIMSQIKVIMSQIKVYKMQPKTLLSLISK